MEASTFALWKFRTVEGRLKGAHGFDFLTTRFDAVGTSCGEFHQLRYDTVNETATLERCDTVTNTTSKIATVPFSGVPELLKQHRLYNVEDLSKRHVSSYSEEERANTN